jgi:hypothetical protein
MWFLWDLFDDVVDITSAPAKFIARWTDKLLSSDGEFEDFVDDMKDSLKTKK